MIKVGDRYALGLGCHTKRKNEERDPCKGVAGSGAGGMGGERR